MAGRLATMGFYGSEVMGDPQVTMGFNTKSWWSMIGMICGYPHDLGNYHMVVLQIIVAVTVTYLNIIRPWLCTYMGA